MSVKALPNGLWSPKGYQQVTNQAGPSVIVTLTVPSKAKFCTVVAFANPNVRWSDMTTGNPTNGPSTALGQIVPNATTMAPMVYMGDPANLQFCITTGTIEVLYYA